MGMPSITVSFTEAAKSFVSRAERGVVGLILFIAGLLVQDLVIFCDILIAVKSQSLVLYADEHDQEHDGDRRRTAYMPRPEECAYLYSPCGSMEKLFSG